MLDVLDRLRGVPLRIRPLAPGEMGHELEQPLTGSVAGCWTIAALHPADLQESACVSSSEVVRLRDGLDRLDDLLLGGQRHRGCGRANGKRQHEHEQEGYLEDS